MIMTVYLLSSILYTKIIKIITMAHVIVFLSIKPKNIHN